jgi:hypothetical protein
LGGKADIAQGNADIKKCPLMTRADMAGSKLKAEFALVPAKFDYAFPG